jgi:hypothetical protein
MDAPRDYGGSAYVQGTGYGQSDQSAGQDFDEEWKEFAKEEYGVDPDKKRLQEIEDDQGKRWLWSASAPAFLIGVETLEYVTWEERKRTGYYYRDADRFLQNPPIFRDIWLTPSRDQRFRSYSDCEPQGELDADCVKVFWPHITEHIYEFCTFKSKEKHSFWPWKTTEEEVLDYLYEALNAIDKFEGRVYDLTISGIPTTLVLEKAEEGWKVKTFYPNLAETHEDFYSMEELQDIFR